MTLKSWHSAIFTMQRNFLTSASYPLNMRVTIAMLLFDNITILDLIGPYEVLSKLPHADIKLTGLEKRPCHDQYGLKTMAAYTCDEVTAADVLVIPGGYGIDPLLKNDKLLSWIRAVDKTTKWTAAVCSGSLLLAQAGLLEGKACTTHWRRKEQLKTYNVMVKDERYVQDGKYITSAGVSAGIDMSLYLASCIANEDVAKMIQLSIEYDPHPPFDCGIPAKAPDRIIQMLKR
jgi:transcriptional regulator GlxA family with amidase domain